MLDKKLKEQIYYGNNQPKKEFNNKAFYILMAVIVGFALIVAIISINSNNNTTHYEQPQQERHLEDIVGEKPADNIEQQTKPKQKTYTEAEIQSDIKAYKNKFIAKVKQNWHPNEESFLIDNDSLQVKIDKSGNVTFPDYPTGSYDANSQVIRQAVESGRPYDKLPDSYDSECLTFKIYFEGNTESYWGNTQSKSSYQVSLSPIKQIYKQPSTQSKPQSNSLNKETSPKTETPLDNIKYKVIVGTYATKEQAALARKIIVGYDNNLSPIIWQSGVNNFTLLIETFNDKTSADALYNKLKENSYPVKIIEENF